MFDLRYPVVVVVALHPRFFLKLQIPTIFLIIINISHTTTIKMVIIFISLLPILFFLTYIPYYHPLIFQLIYSPNGHHEFNFLSPFILFFYFLKIKTHFMKGNGQFIPLTWLNFCYFFQLVRNCQDSLTSPQCFTHIWSSRTPN